MRCLNCSTPVPDDSKFCLSCGTDLSDPSADSQTSLTDDGVSNMERKLRADTEGDFEIERELGRGGMAVVYLASDVHLRRKVAIKVLPPDLTFGKGTIERFRREAQTAAQLDHPNIIPVYRISTGGDLFWYAMKFIEGRSLDEILKEGLRFDLNGCTDVLDQVAAALDWAHRRQVVHRDVKPANIMIDPTGRVTMADFGIAKALSKTSLTASGSAIGTPNYMSPEQCMGGEITGAVDQYALGVVTYQMLSGKLPFEADSAVELIQKHCFVPPPSLEEARPGLPPNVYAAVERSLAKKSGERFASIADFVGALRDPSRMSAGGIATPSWTPIPTVTPSATPIPVDEQSTTPMPAVTPVPIDEASTTPMPSAVPTPAPPPPSRSAAYEGAPTEVIRPVGKRRRMGVAAVAIAALVVVAGGIGFIVMGRGADEPAPTIAAPGDSGSDSLGEQTELAVLGTTPPADSELTSEPGPGEETESAQAEQQPPAGAPAVTIQQPEEITQPQGARAEPTVARVDTTPPVTQERRDEPPPAVIPVVVDDPKPEAERKPNPVTELPAPPELGSEVWSRTVEYYGKGSPSVGPDGTVYVGSGNNAVYAFNSNGSLKWTVSTSLGVRSAPAIGPDGTIYVGTGDGNLYAIDPDSTVKWVVAAGSQRQGLASPAVGADGTIYVGSLDGNLYAFGPGGGPSQWQFPTGGRITNAAAIGMDGTIYVASLDGFVYAVAPNNTRRWRYQVGEEASAPALGPDRTIYVQSANGTVHAIDHRSGTRKWAQLVSSAESSALSSPVVGPDGTVYVGSADEYIHARDGRTGDPKWLRKLVGRVIMSPALGADGTVFVGTTSGRLYAVNPGGQSLKWDFLTESGLRAPTVGPDGTLYVVSGDGKLYAIHDNSGGLANSSWPKAGHDNANSGYVGRD